MGLAWHLCSSVVAKRCCISCVKWESDCKLCQVSRLYWSNWSLCWLWIWNWIRIFRVQSQTFMTQHFMTDCEWGVRLWYILYSLTFYSAVDMTCRYWWVRQSEALPIVSHGKYADKPEKEIRPWKQLAAIPWQHQEKEDKPCELKRRSRQRWAIRVRIEQNSDDKWNAGLFVVLPWPFA